jgi:uncharacterized protein (DUF433 family)
MDQPTAPGDGGRSASGRQAAATGVPSQASLSSSCATPPTRPPIAVSSVSVTFERITIEPDKMDGQPCIRGLRFPVVTVLRMVAGGMSVKEILDEHPDLEAEDIPAALNYAAEALAEHYYPLRPPA